jgi:hypothetical protein
MICWLQRQVSLYQSNQDRLIEIQDNQIACFDSSQNNLKKQDNMHMVRLIIGFETPREY